jgi:hypothetical protein
LFGELTFFYGMKRIAYSFLLIFLLSCGPRSELKGNRVLINFRDTIPHEYYLIAVHDSGLVVSPGFFDNAGSPFIIPFSRISRVRHDVGGKTTGMLLGGLIGCTSAMGTAIAIGTAGGNAGSGEGVAFGAAFVSLPALALGMIIGYNSSDDDKIFDLSKAHDRDALREFARYPDHEPPELQKIK